MNNNHFFDPKQSGRRSDCETAKEEQKEEGENQHDRSLWELRMKMYKRELLESFRKSILKPEKRKKRHILQTLKQQMEKIEEEKVQDDNDYLGEYSEQDEEDGNDYVIQLRPAVGN